MFGHQDDILSGHSFKAQPESDSFETSDIKDVCGDYPALLGLDLGRVEWADLNIDGIDIDNIVNAAKVHYQRGGLITISWHANNPVTKKNVFDISNPQTVELVLSDTEAREEYMKRLQKVANIIDLIRDHKGRKIPIIFRPFHEENQGFWWSVKNTTSENYKALWQITFDYLVKERKLKNLIWAYSPYNIRNSEKYEINYPGDDYVDIVCYEKYQGEGGPANFMADVKDGLFALSEFAKKHKKIPAMSECGFSSIKEDNWWTQTLLPSIEGASIAYVLVWRNYTENPQYYAPFKGQKSESDFVKLYKSKRFLFLNEL